MLSTNHIDEMVPKFKVQGSSTASLSIPDLPWDLTERSLQALQNLSNHVPSKEPCPESVPAFRRAAVLLGIFGGRNGELYVIVSKRSSKLRSHAGESLETMREKCDGMRGGD